MAYRRPKSLRDLLVHAKLKPDPKDNEPLGESKPCGRARCQTCKMILGTQTVKSSSGAVVKLKCDTNDKTANVVYPISSCKCQKQYVGETKGPLNLRMNGHCDDWKHCRFERSPVAEHFRSQNMTSSNTPLFVALTISQSGQILPGNLARVTGSAV